MASTSTRIKRAQEINAIKEKIRKSLPVLTRSEIRRCRIPYHEALCMELEEAGFLKSVSFIRSVIGHQERVRSHAGPESTLWSRPLLRDHKDMLHVLYNGVKAAEIAFHKDRPDEECDSVLKIGVFFAEQAQDWWWLADHLLLVATHCASAYEGDGGKRHAIARYVYGRFLLFQMKNAEKAEEHLSVCRMVSIGHNWSAKEVVPAALGSIHKECCSLLYRALLIIARQLKDVDPVRATKTCLRAQKRAGDAEDNSGIAECLMEVGLCESKLGDSKHAVSRFNKVLLIRTELNELAGICDTYIKIAAAHSMLGNIAEANRNLNILLEYSKQHSLRYFYGQALRLLGESHLNHGHAHAATQYLTEALQVFHELDDYDNREQVKNLAAISTGQEFLDSYRTIVHSPTDANANLPKLINWKDSREMFWATPETQVNLFQQTEDPLVEPETDSAGGEEEERAEVEAEASEQSMAEAVESVQTIYRRESSSASSSMDTDSEESDEDADENNVLQL